MKLFFKEKNIDNIITKIKEHITNTNFSDFVSVSDDNENINILIQKLGRSQIVFSQEKDYWLLTQEKVAFSHKIYRKNVLKKICEIVKKMGGKIK